MKVEMTDNSDKKNNKKEEMEKSILKLFNRQRKTTVNIEGTDYTIKFNILTMGEYIEIAQEEDEDDLKIAIKIFNKAVIEPKEIVGKAEELPAGFVIEVTKRITDKSFLMKEQ